MRFMCYFCLTYKILDLFFKKDKNVIIQSKLLENIINLTNIMLIYMKKVE